VLWWAKLGDEWEQIVTLRDDIQSSAAWRTAIGYHGSFPIATWHLEGLTDLILEGRNDYDR